ncbi:MAG: redoxin domain-containing protein [Verrucomicrobia bacterium]|nr:redoxin domain-containing protein [Verrucomicrobiota bacterium]
MNRRTTITLFYTVVAVLCLGILAVAFHLRSRLPEPDLATIVAAGRATPPHWFPITRDLEAVRQDGARVRLSDLRGKVWIAAEFFAVCPHCAVRNGEELRKLYDEFRDHPDFHIVCITVDPENDDRARLADYATALGANVSDWWFLNAGDAAATHAYLEQELKFFGVRERSDPRDIEANGRYAHDLGFLLVDRGFRVVGKWPLADARSDEAKRLDPGLYERLKTDLVARIRTELSSTETPAP